MISTRLHRVKLGFVAVCAAAAAMPSSGRAATPTASAQISAVTEYSGAADASGGVAIGAGFFIVCEDEESVLRVYRRSGGGAPVAEIDLGEIKALRVPGAKKELDLEAAARMGDVVYWIGSHGNSKDGDVTPNRRQLFATTITENQGRFRVELTGKPYRRLVEDLIAAPALRAFKLTGAAAMGRAPKDEGGFNIEGLAASPEGHLWLGFRNPVPRGRTLLVPLLNPVEMMRGRPAKIGQPVELDLGGRGIREIARVGEGYFIVAGEFGEAERGKLVSQLYRWAGPGAVPQMMAEFPKFNPEALIAYPGTASRELQVLSDDGQKPPLPGKKRTFRSVKVSW